MGLTAGQIPRVANVLNSGGASMFSGSNIATIGSNNNGVTVYTAGAQGGRVISMMGTTDDTTTVNVFVWILRGGVTVVPIGMVNIPLSSGNTNAARFPVDFLNGTNLPGLPIDNTGRQYIPLAANDLVRVGSLATLGVNRYCYVTTAGLDYQT